MFPLCRLCCENLSLIDCEHEDIRKQEFAGPWVSDELKTVVELGYTITVIYEIWAFKMLQYKPNGSQRGLFVDYIYRYVFETETRVKRLAV